MKRGYLAISYSNRRHFDNEVASLRKLFQEFGIELLVFVDKYHFKKTQEHEMMTSAFSEIDSSDFLIAELSTKSIGVGIEIGYAFAKGMPIIYLRKMKAEYSTTAAGSATYILEYENEDDLRNSMAGVLKELI